MITYRKARDGRWVACGPVAEMKVGGVVVRKRDGSSTTEVIDRLGTPFSEDGVPKVYGYLRSSGEPRPVPKRGARMERSY